MKKLLALLLSLLMVASVFVACGDEAKDDDKSKTETSEKEESKEESKESSEESEKSDASEEKDLAKAIIGSWYGEDDGVTATFTFKDESKGYITMGEGENSLGLWFEYELDDDTMVITVEGETFFDGTVAFKGEKLSMTMDGDEQLFEATETPDEPAEESSEDESSDDEIAYTEYNNGKIKFNYPEAWDATTDDDGDDYLVNENEDIDVSVYVDEEGYDYYANLSSADFQKLLEDEAKAQGVDVEYKNVDVQKMDAYNGFECVIASYDFVVADMTCSTAAVAIDVDGECWMVMFSVYDIDNIEDDWFAILQTISSTIDVVD